MIRTKLPHIAALAAVFIAIVVARSLGGDDLSDGGCSDRDVRFAPTLNQEAILEVRPNGALVVNTYSGCDTDDGFAYAGRTYRNDMTRADLLKFYRAAAERAGWTWAADGTPVPSEGLVISAAQICFTKQIDNAEAYLSLWFPSDFNSLPDEPDAPTGDYGLNLTASHDGGAWC